MKVVLAVDLSRDSRAAVRFLERMRIPVGSVVSVLHVLTVPPVPLQGPAIPLQLAAWCKEAVGYARRFLDRIERRFAGQGIRVGTLIKQGLPEIHILQTIKRVDADLVVLGSHGLTGIPHFLLGSVSEKILSHAPCSVLVVRVPRPAHRDSRRGLRIVLAMDESPDAKASLEFLEKVNLPPASRVMLLHVTEKREGTAAWLVAKGRSEFHHAIEQAILAERQQKANRLERMLQRLRARGISVEVSLAEGHPAEEILKVAKRQRAHVIVMGSRGLAGVKRFLMGGVSQQVARHAPCSVLLVRR